MCAKVQCLRNLCAEMKHRINGTKIVPEASIPQVKIQHLGGREYAIQHGHHHHQAFLIAEDKTAKTSTWWIDGHTYSVQTQSTLDELLNAMGMGVQSQAGADKLKAPMPGMVLAIHAQPGATVSKGDPLIVLEAMKMENILKAPQDGVIEAIQAKVGHPVEKGAVLLTYAS